MKYIILCLGLLFVASCGNEYVVEDNFDLEELPGYVAFDAPGNSIVIDDVLTAEDGGELTFTIECPTGTLSDITVNYKVSGNAVLGTDYNIAGLNGDTGSVVISPNEADFLNRDNVDLVVELLTDEMVDGEKSLTITLDSATNAEGSLAVGRGGTDLLKTVNISIGDVDCVSDLAGMYSATATYAVHDFLPDYPTNTMDMEVVEVSPGVYSVADISAGLYTDGPYAINYTTTGLPFEFGEICGVVSWSGQMDPWQNILPVAGMDNSVDENGVITITVTGDVYGETWTTVFTPQ